MDISLKDISLRPKCLKFKKFRKKLNLMKSNSNCYPSLGFHLERLLVQANRNTIHNN